MSIPDIDIAVFRHSMPDKISNKNVVIIDTHNFTTTAIEALSNGAKEIVPLTSIKGGISNRITVIAGDGNHEFENHPKYMNSENVQNEVIGIDSWNGSKSVHNVRQLIDENVNVYLGSLTNSPAISLQLQTDEKPILFVLAGSDGNIPPEDILTVQCIYNCLYGESTELESIIKTYEQFYNLTVREIYDKMYENKESLGSFGRPSNHATKFASKIGSRTIIPKMNQQGGFE